MDTLSKPEIILSSGALIAVVGSSWYFNNKIEELQTGLTTISDTTAKLIQKIGNETSPQVRSLYENIRNLNDGFNELKINTNTLIMDIQNLNKVIRKQDKFIKAIQINLEIVNSQLEIDTKTTEKESEDYLITNNIKPKKDKKKKHPAKKKELIRESDVNDVLSEMNSI